MSKTPDDFLKAIPRPAGKPKNETTVNVFGPVFESGWHLVPSKPDKSAKKVEDWNKQDQVRYFYTSYRERFGVPLPGNVPWQLCYMKLEELRQTLRHQLKIEDECPTTVVRDYVDFFFRHLVDEALAARNGNISFSDLARQRYVRSFLRSHSVSAAPPVSRPVQEAVAAVPDQPAASDCPQLNELDEAYSVHSQYFVGNFGVIVPACYLVRVVGKSQEEAVAYVEKAFSRMKKSEQQRALDSTARHGPYPKSLPILSFRDATIELCDDKSGRYAYLRN